MLHRNAAPRLTNNVVAIRPLGGPEQLERLARKPLTPRRDLLRELAERHRTLDVLVDEQRQLTFEDVA